MLCNAGNKGVGFFCDTDYIILNNDENVNIALDFLSSVCYHRGTFKGETTDYPSPNPRIFTNEYYLNDTTQQSMKVLAEKENKNIWVNEDSQKLRQMI